LRRQDDSRRQKREELKERKQREKEQKKEDLKQLKKFKLKEIQDKIEQLKAITGNSSLPFQVRFQFTNKYHVKSATRLILFRMPISMKISIRINTTRR